MGLPVRKSKVAAPPACPLTESLALLRGAWAPNVIWFLSGEPRRFGELRHDIPRISARVLSARLRELESRGLVTRRVLKTSPPSAEYALTPLGHELLPAIQALASVGQKLIAGWETGALKRAPAAAHARGK
ncbi:winged helix-turn-helix transcriptional regulator [Rhodanobacter ginsengisoli]|uniref:Winged helix-turn-helix transcriptional regulator n=1 Tax=Rhodanobacter ginsengisoli TaxID=418646 RepID=A0ABW0QMA7_9GAMM